jgi:hypothetical protein
MNRPVKTSSSRPSDNLSCGCKKIFANGLEDSHGITVLACRINRISLSHREARILKYRLGALQTLELVSLHQRGSDNGVNHA